MNFFQKITNFYSHIILFVILFIMAFSSVKSYNIDYKQNIEKINTAKDEIVAECEINSYPQLKNGTIQARGKVYDSSVSKLEGQNLLFKFPAQNCNVKMGYKIRVKGTVETALGASNPGSFDYREHLKSQNITGIFSVSDKSATVLSKPGKILGRIYRLKENFINNANKILPYGASGLIRAVAGGDRTDIDGEDETNFKESGIYHVVAISGLHLNIFICALYGYIGKLKIKRKYKALLSFGSCLLIGSFVMIFTGYGPSVIRAFVMSTLFSLASVVSRHYNSKRSLLLTGFVIIILTPYSFYSVAFQLSFLSTLGVLCALDFIKYLKKNEFLPLIYENAVGITFCISVYTTIFTLVITVDSFGFIPIYSWITNVLILPVMPYLLGAGAFFAAFIGLLPSFFVSLLGYFITGIYAYISFVAKFVSSLYGATVDVYTDTLLYTVFCALFLAIITFLFFKKRGKQLIAAMLIFTVAVGGFLVYNMRDNGEIEVTFADVGQGDSCLIQSGSESIMIDCGTSSDAEYYASSIEKMLRHKNIKKIDVAIVTHYHSDHMNIMEELLSKGKIRKLLLPHYYDSTETEAKENKLKLLFAAMKSNTEISYVKAGDSIVWDGDIQIDFLLPDSSMYFENNDMSLITKLTYGNTKFLFCGDAQQAEFEKCMPKDISCNVIKIAHHGGFCEGTQDFIKMANPEFAVISCSRYNLYNHPDDRVIKILEDEKCKIKRTDLSGAIIVKANKNKIIYAKGMR